MRYVFNNGGARAAENQIISAAKAEGFTVTQDHTDANDPEPHHVAAKGEYRADSGNAILSLQYHPFQGHRQYDGKSNIPAALDVDVRQSISEVVLQGIVEKAIKDHRGELDKTVAVRR